MSKAKIEAMSVEEIKEIVEFQRNRYNAEIRAWRRLILAWIHTEARARRAHALLTWIATGKEGPQPSFFDEDWIADVKKEVGWPEDQERRDDE